MHEKNLVLLQVEVITCYPTSSNLHGFGLFTYSRLQLYSASPSFNVMSMCVGEEREIGGRVRKGKEGLGEILFTLC